MTPILKEFYQDIQEWIDDGCPKHKIFYADGGGLCTNLEVWCDYYYQHYPELFQDLYTREVVQALKASFREKGLDAKFPFNDGSASDFLKECSYETTFKNKKRLQWIRERANED